LGMFSKILYFMPSIYGESFDLDILLFIKKSLERKENILDSNFFTWQIYNLSLYIIKISAI